MLEQRHRFVRDHLQRIGVRRECLRTRQDFEIHRFDFQRHTFALDTIGNQVVHCLFGEVTAQGDQLRRIVATRECPT